MSSKHVVQRVSAKAVIESDKAILILHPSGIDLNRNWHIPGGIRDDINELMLDTAIREVREETRIKLPSNGRVFKIGEWRAVDKGEQVKILAVFYHFTLPSRPVVELSHEHDNFAWVNRDNYHKYPANKEVYEIIEELFKV